MELKVKDAYSLGEFGLVSPAWLAHRIAWNGSETEWMDAQYRLLTSGRKSFTLDEIADFAEIVYPSWALAVQEHPEDHTPLEVHNANQYEARREHILDKVARMANFRKGLEDPEAIEDRQAAVDVARYSYKKYRELADAGKEYEEYVYGVRVVNYLMGQFELDFEKEVYPR